MRMNRCVRISLIGCFAFHCAATATELLFSGGFESNGGAATSILDNWTVVSQAGSGGSWYAQTGTGSPVNGLPVPAPPEGSFAAMTDAAGPGTNVLLQSFTVPTSGVAVLSFQYTIANLGPDFINPDSLDYTAGANQQVRVDILTAGAGAFDLGASVLLNLLQPQPGDTLIGGAYLPVSFDISSVVGLGGTFQLRFAEVDTQQSLLFGVDSASISFTANTAGTPEPGSLLLLAAGLPLLALRQLRRRR